MQLYRNKTLLVIICSLGLLVTSCGGGGNTMGPGENGDDDQNPPSEDTDRLVSFSEDIEPIFTGSCATSGCHDAGTQESGVDLSSYESALSSEGIQYGGEIIIPGDPEGSPIVDKVANDNPEHGVRMPEGGPYLSSAEIDSIRAWIEDDAPDN